MPLPLSIDSVLENFKGFGAAETPVPDAPETDAPETEEGVETIETTETDTTSETKPEAKPRKEARKEDEKADPAGDTDTATEPDGIAHLRQLHGLTDEDGEFDASLEGIEALTLKVAEKAKQAAGEEVFAALYEQFPGLQEYLTYQAQGGDPAKYFEVLASGAGQEYDLSKERDQEAVVRAYMEAKGLDEDDIEEQIDALSDKGKLKERAEKLLPKITAEREEAKKELLAAQAEQVKAQQAQVKQYWSGVEQAIQKGAIGKGGEVVIPAPERQKFYDYLAKPVNRQGQAGFDADWNAMSEGEKLAIKFLVYKKGDVSALAKRQQTSKQAEQATKLLAKTAPTKLTGGAGGNTKSAAGLGFDFNDLKGVLSESLTNSRSN